MPHINIRLVHEADSTRILEIYRPYVEQTAISFEYEVPTQAEFTERVRNVAREYPYLVYTIDENIVAYAYAHKHMERAAYQWNATLSVYVDSGYQRQGIGKQLYACLIEILKLQNITMFTASSRPPTLTARSCMNPSAFAVLASTVKPDSNTASGTTLPGSRKALVTTRPTRRLSSPSEILILRLSPQFSRGTAKLHRQKDKASGQYSFIRAISSSGAPGGPHVHCRDCRCAP